MKTELGSILSKVNDGPEQTFSAAAAWWEPPGTVQRVSRNASATEPATLLAIYIAPKGVAAAELMKPKHRGDSEKNDGGLRTLTRPTRCEGV